MNAKPQEKHSPAANPSEGDGVKATRHRSPNYPVFGLQKAVERASELYNKYKRALVPINLAHELWQYKPHSGTGNQAVAALKTYGLIEVEGEGKDRKIRLTDAGHRIVANAPDRSELLKKSAIAPAIHQELWDKYRVEDHFPDDALIVHYLQWDREEGKFNEESVRPFVDNFRSSLRYSGLLSTDGTPAIVTKEVLGDDKDKPAALKVGDLVQWTSGGCDMFSEPREILGLSDDGLFAFVPKSSTDDTKADTGIPVDQITVVGKAMKPKEETMIPAPPINPFKEVGQKTLPPTQGMKEDVYDLPGGKAAIRYPAELDEGSVEELEEWLGLIVRKMKRVNNIETKTDPKKRTESKVTKD